MPSNSVNVSRGGRTLLGQSSQREATTSGLSSRRKPTLSSHSARGEIVAVDAGEDAVSAMMVSGRKRKKTRTPTRAPVEPDGVIEISSDEEDRTRILTVRSNGHKQSHELQTSVSASTATTNIREVIEAAFDANATLREDLEHRTRHLEQELRIALEKAANLQKQADAACESKADVQKEHEALCDTLAALQQELEVAYAAHDQTRQEAQTTLDKNVRLEQEIQRTRDLFNTQRAQLVKFEEESTSMAVLAQVNAQLEELKTGNSRAQDFFSRMEQNVDCTICAYVLYNPCVLPCGHTFCQTCLEEYFDGIFAEHVVANPALDVPDVLPYHQALRQVNLDEAMRQQIRLELANVQAAHPRPAYICPMCRTPVTSTPAQNFALRDISELVGHIRGERNPRQADNGVRRNDGLLDRFFGVLQ
ncbi:uncharacterized protein B0H18DRAFT_989628 [Fomitopsis serialis]|uniref:uncharacterized protein n=1 Tax=Fomitopsis serialis TaxID=139415 RepID=UPI002008197F|nr:uncharacterized protein B0H18DRAFT_989628 [Neoantrodia serialis]KAH9931495.1 hypothetical protein B0H18DRAFT_989628 [Neoantrodia serialis]